MRRTCLTVRGTRRSTRSSGAEVEELPRTGNPKTVARLLLDILSIGESQLVIAAIQGIDALKLREELTQLPAEIKFQPRDPVKGLCVGNVPRLEASGLDYQEYWRTDPRGFGRISKVARMLNQTCRLTCGGTYLCSSSRQQLVKCEFDRNDC